MFGTFVLINFGCRIFFFLISPQTSMDPKNLNVISTVQLIYHIDLMSLTTMYFMRPNIESRMFLLNIHTYRLFRKNQKIRWNINFFHFSPITTNVKKHFFFFYIFLVIYYLLSSLQKIKE